MAYFADNAAINLRLGMLGLPLPKSAKGSQAAELVAPLLARQQELSRRLENQLCPVDSRIQGFLDDYLADTQTNPKLPGATFVLDQAGLARTLSLPMDGDSFFSEHISSYRLANGVLHNPVNDRRTTQGVFHIAEGGLPIPDDKVAVSREAYGRLLEHALAAPPNLLKLPYGANQSDAPACWVSLLLRPTVVPMVPSFTQERSFEVRFFAPGNLIANLDFVESIFGNGGDPYLPQNDAALKPLLWTGHTGAVILAPHLTKLTKKELGLPHYDEATERQRRDRQCWKHEDELYNDGLAFKACARDEHGVIVTVIADNYFGYCKKEVKTQISYSANLLGMVEEEHAGGANCFPRYNLGQQYTDKYADDSYQLADVVARDPQRFLPQPEGHALDAEQEQIILVPAHSTFSLRDNSVRWHIEGRERSIPLRADKTYVGPDGYQVKLHHLKADGDQWTLVGTVPKATSCHKPATVSGGGKSEISKAITDAFIPGNAYCRDFDQDIVQVREILERNYSDRFADPNLAGSDTRPILSDQRSVGSVIKLLTPSPDYSVEFNDWIETIPHYIKELVYVVKRYYRPEWGADWESHFTVGTINGRKGHSLRLDGEKIHVNMLRVGFEPDGSWRLFGLRHDFHPAAKVQTQDDISASIVAPGRVTATELSRKFVHNCENLLFQRPDDAIHRGYDKQAERDIASPGTFLSNFQPMTREDAIELVSDAVSFSQFSPPIQELIQKVADSEGSPQFFVSSAHPRLVNGVRSKNPRYLQQRPDRANPQETAIAELSARLYRKLPMAKPLLASVDVIAAGRRNNPAEDGIPPLCAYSPLHYMELPELFMEFISSMTGKSPSTTGAGSEGAMTKGPFNCLLPAYDLNAAFLSFVLSGYDGWLSSAGYIGPKVRIDHDFSLLVPEVFSRMTDAERDAEALIAEGSLEPLQDSIFDGEPVLASRLGYRMTAKFATKYFGRIFLHPHVVFDEQMLRPELQDEAAFAESLRTIVATHKRVATAYLADGSLTLAVPPVRGLLEIMATGQTATGLTLQDPDFRSQFTRDRVLGSDWYAERLQAQRESDISYANRSLAHLDAFAAKEQRSNMAQSIGVTARRATIRARLAEYEADTQAEYLMGTLGRQPNWR